MKVHHKKTQNLPGVTIESPKFRISCSSSRSIFTLFLISVFCLIFPSLYLSLFTSALRAPFCADTFLGLKKFSIFEVRSVSLLTTFPSKDMIQNYINSKALKVC